MKRRWNIKFACTLYIGVTSITNTLESLQVVMSKGRTPGRHDGRDTEVRRFSPLALC